MLFQQFVQLAILIDFFVQRDCIAAGPGLHFYIC